jgi:hypothetical protein
MATFRSLFTSGKLQVQAKLLGSVTGAYLVVSELSKDPMTTDLEDVMAWSTWIRCVMQLQDYPGRCPLEEAIFRTIIFPDYYDSWYAEQATWAVFSQWIYWITGLPDACVLTDGNACGWNEPSGSRGDSRAMNNIRASQDYRDTRTDRQNTDFLALEDAISHLRGYAFIILDSDYIGAAYQTCKEGDQVFLLAGAHCPMVLRPRGNGEYQFIAPAYIHGVMNGEAWPEDEEELQDLTLI